MAQHGPPWHLSEETNPEQELAVKQEQQQAMERRSSLQAALRRVHALESQHVHAPETADPQEMAQAIDHLHALFIEAAVGWVEQKWGPNRECPYCGSAEWTVSRPFNLLLESRETLSPHFSVVCTNCGNTVLINALLAGLFPDPNE
jgi:hypothetical protein